jgi:hypothetical protein
VEGGVALDWDEANIAHIGRHGVTPDDVIQTFSNDAIDLNYEVVNGEDPLDVDRPYGQTADSGRCVDDARGGDSGGNRIRCGSAGGG